jgi:hypothetical protein
MSTKMSRHTYIRTIEEDIEWLKDHTVPSLERSHIIEVLRRSIEVEYGAINDVVEAAQRAVEANLAAQRAGNALSSVPHRIGMGDLTQKDAEKLYEDFITADRARRTAASTLELSVKVLPEETPT